MGLSRDDGVDLHKLHTVTATVPVNIFRNITISGNSLTMTYMSVRWVWKLL